MEIELANQRSFYVIKTRFESKIESPFYLIKFGGSHIVQTRDRQELITWLLTRASSDYDCIKSWLEEKLVSTSQNRLGNIFHPASSL